MASDFVHTLERRVVGRKGCGPTSRLSLLVFCGRGVICPSSSPDRGVSGGDGERGGVKRSTRRGLRLRVGRKKPRWFCDLRYIHTTQHSLARQQVKSVQRVLLFVIFLFFVYCLVFSFVVVYFLYLVRSARLFARAREQKRTRPPHVYIKRHRRWCRTLYQVGRRRRRP